MSLALTDCGLSLAVSEPTLPDIPSFHHDIATLYSEVKRKPYLTKDSTPRLDAQLDTVAELILPELALSRRLLLSKLRPYQMEAVRWMVAKERGSFDRTVEMFTVVDVVVVD